MSSVRLIVSTPDTPTTMGTRSQAVKLGQIVWRSGWTPLDPTPSRLLGGQTGLFQGTLHKVQVAGDYFHSIVTLFDNVAFMRATAHPKSAVSLLRNFAIASLSALFYVSSCAY